MNCFLFAGALLLGAPVWGQSTQGQGGDLRHVEFVQPLSAAMDRAKAEGRMLLLIPIYGGLDLAGASDYRTGGW